MRALVSSDSDRIFTLNPKVAKLETCTIVYMIVNELKDVWNARTNKKESVLCCMDGGSNFARYLRRIAYDEDADFRGIGFRALTAISIPMYRGNCKMTHGGCVRYRGRYPDWNVIDESDMFYLVEQWKRVLPVMISTQAREKLKVRR